MNTTASLSYIRENLRNQGYISLHDADFNSSPQNRESINAFYNETVLQNDMPNVYPVDRLRARDVVNYMWQNEKPLLSEHTSITIKTPRETRGNHPHEVVREYKRIFLLGDPAFKELIEHLLLMLPPEERQPQGTVGINLFKTFSDVVSGPHQDGVQFVGIYIPDKNCEGSETTLIPISDPDKVVFRKSLEAGDFLIFRDKDFMHNVSPLEPPKDGSPKYRDALILTVDYEDTYRLL